MTKLQTEFPIVNHLLEELLANLTIILKDNLLGVYVYGSLVWGDFDEATSDIDVFVALNHDITTDDFNALAQAHTRIANRFPVWHDRIEIAYASRKLLQSFKTATGKIAVISPGEPFNIKDAGTDWLINYYLLLNKCLRLCGPSPKSIITPISKSEFVNNVKQQAIAWEDWVVHTEHSTGFQYYAVLTLCRALYVIHYHEQVSKLKAGTWALGQYPKWRDLIQRALTKTGQTDISPHLIQKNWKEVTRFVHEIVQHIRKGK